MGEKKNIAASGMTKLHFACLIDDSSVVQCLTEYKLLLAFSNVKGVFIC